MTLTELTKYAGFAEICFSNGIHVVLAYRESTPGWVLRDIWWVWRIGKTNTLRYFREESDAAQYALELSNDQ